MADLSLRLVPDPALRAICAPVDDFDAALLQTAKAMLDVMYAAKGRGLAAPQVGLITRVFVMDSTWKSSDPTPRIFVNPEMTACSETIAVFEEGCLSIPNQTSRVARPDRVSLRWQGVDGAFQSGDFTGFEAACVQHEIDHLNGVLCTDYPEAP